MSQRSPVFAYKDGVKKLKTSKGNKKSRNQAMVASTFLTRSASTDIVN